MPTIDHLLAHVAPRWDDAAALVRIGRELHDRNRLPASRVVLGRALELDPKVSPDAWIWLAFAQFRDWREEEGFATLRKGIEVTDSDRIRSSLLGFTPDEAEQHALHERLEKSDDPAIRADLEWAKLWAGDEGALDRVAALAEANPDDDDLRSTYAFMLIGARRQKKTGKDLREVGIPLAKAKIAAAPDAISGYSLWLQMLLVEEDWDGLLTATAGVLNRFPDEESVMQWRGQAFEKKGDDERAAHWYARAIGAKPSFAGARRDLGKLYERQGNLDRAEEIFREIPAAYPQYPIGPVSLALFLSRHERWEEAEKLLIDAWPGLPEWAKGSLKGQPDAAALMARDAVKAVVGEEENQADG